MFSVFWFSVDMFGFLLCLIFSVFFCLVFGFFLIIYIVFLLKPFFVTSCYDIVDSAEILVVFVSFLSTCFMLKEIALLLAFQMLLIVEFWINLGFCFIFIWFDMFCWLTFLSSLDFLFCRFIGSCDFFVCFLLMLCQFLLWM